MSDFDGTFEVNRTFEKKKKTSTCWNVAIYRIFFNASSLISGGKSVKRCDRGLTIFADFKVGQRDIISQPLVVAESIYKLSNFVFFEANVFNRF